MAAEENEYRKRQRQRAEARRQREIARKKMMLRLIVVGVVLVACAVVITVVAIRARKVNGTAQNLPKQDAGQQTTDERETTTAPEQTEKNSRTAYTTVRVAVAGDLNVNAATVAAGLTPSGYDYTQVFQDVAPLLANADVTVLNFEGNLCGAPYGQSNASAPQEMMQTIADMGVDLVQMANSYPIRNGLLGLESTLAGIRAAGMEPLGAYASNAEFRQSKGYTIREINGIRIAFVAFTKGMDNLGLPDGSEYCVNVLYNDYAATYQDVATSRINSILRNIREEKPDYTIALLHWGSEYNDELSGTQETIRSLLLAGGVDAIVGTHSHRVQKVDFDRETGAFVAYSLGDFFSDAQKAGTNYSVVLNLEITRDNATGETKLTDYTCTPIYTMTPEESGETGLRVVRTETAVEFYEAGFYHRVSETAYDNMKYTLERIESRLSGE